MAPSFGTLLSAIFLVAGTCIGGGMLALPVMAGISGFVPSTIAMSVCWVGMTISALLLMEASLWMHEGEHMISMAARLLGPVGKWVSWFLYLFICYASNVAYTAGGGEQIASFLSSVFQVEISKPIGCGLFIVIFGGVTYLGSKIIGRVNSILFVAMIAAYFALVGIGTGEVKLDLLQHRYWPTTLIAIPFLLTSFSFQTMVPSLTPYLQRHAKSMRWAIIGGTTTAFFVYLIWQVLMLGIVPVNGENGLVAAFNQGESPIQFLEEHVYSSHITSIANFFAFFALVTSFLGITMGLFDFLADGLQIPEKGAGQMLLGALVIIPTVFFAIYFERAFLLALDTSGGFGDSILNGIIPVLMVWVGRYSYGFKGAFEVPGGKMLLGVIFIFFSGTLVIEVLSKLNALPVP